MPNETLRLEFGGSSERHVAASYPSMLYVLARGDTDKPSDTFVKPPSRVRGSHKHELSCMLWSHNS